MSGEYQAQSKHLISANRLHKNVRLRIGFRRRTFLWQLGGRLFVSRYAMTLQIISRFSQYLQRFHRLQSV